MARKTYNHEFKIAAAKLVRDQGDTIKKAAESLGVSPGSIRTWVYSHAPALAPPAPDASLELLHRENVRLCDHKAAFPIEILCKVLKVSHGGYYAWSRRPPSLAHVCVVGPRLALPGGGTGPVLAAGGGLGHG